MRRIFNIKNKGFTLLELLIVISIIGVLGSISYAPYSRSQAKARDNKRVSELRSIQNSLMLYSEDHRGCYPQGSKFYYFGTNSYGMSYTLAESNYKYISKSLYDLINNDTQTPTIGAWSKVGPYKYRSVGNNTECDFAPNTSIYSSISNGLSTSFGVTVYLYPRYQLYVELETKNNSLNDDADADMSSYGGGDNIGLDLSSSTLELCNDDSTSTWDCIYDLSSGQ